MIHQFTLTSPGVGVGMEIVMVVLSFTLPDVPSGLSGVTKTSELSVIAEVFTTTVI